MNMKVCEGLEIVGVDNSALDKLKRTSNSLEVGASTILEALDMFADEILDKYEYEPTVPYEKLFTALKQIIHSASESERVRDALMTGYLCEKGFIPPKREVKVEKKNIEGAKKRNKAVISKYAKNHTVKDITEHFGFTNCRTTGQYLRSNNIKFIKSEKGRPASEFNIEQVREMAKSMRLCELSRTFNVSKDIIMYFCDTHKIEYKKGPSYNLEQVKAYAKEHTYKEVAAYFNFTSPEAARTYLYKFKIDFKKG